ncbi:hypothetical protein CH75_06590 [Dyella jiangningensis]|nr:hypothetical protein CH75_06590 [Dyella jiangningensis]
MEVAKKSNKDIQVLRAIAIVMVVLNHWRGRLPSTTGYVDLSHQFALWAGVDIFLAISGYLMYGILQRQLARAESVPDAMKSFWWRRITRLMPAAVFWVVLSIPAAMILPSPSAPIQALYSGAAGLLGGSNIFWATCAHYHFTSPYCGSPDFNGVTWSLSLEWQLYAVMALCMAFARKRVVLIFVAIALIASLFRGDAWNLAWVMRPHAFAMGIVVAYAEQKGYLRFMRHRAAASAILFAGLAIVLLSQSISNIHTILPIVGVGSGLCIAAATNGSIFRVGLFTKVAAWIGDRSYSIYLFHMPLMMVMGYAMKSAGVFSDAPSSILGGFVAFTVVARVICDLSYRFIEQRFHRSRWERPSEPWNEIVTPAQAGH